MTDRPTPEQIVREQIERDRLLYGTAFEIRHKDGRIERIDPTLVVVHTRHPSAAANEAAQKEPTP